MEKEMKKMKMWIASVMAAAAAFGASAQEGQFDVYVYMVRGPLKSDASYAAWSSNVVWKLYMNRTLIDEDVGFTLTPDMVCENSEFSNQGLWSVVRIAAKSSLSMCSLNQLLFDQVSSDTSAGSPRGSLADTYDLRNIANLIYTSRAKGVIWGIGGPRVSDTVLDSNNDGTTPVNEICFIGKQSIYYYPYETSAVSAYFNGFVNGFWMTMRCAVMRGESSAGMGQRTLQTVGAPMQPLLSISSTDTSVIVGSNFETNRTALIYSSPNVDPPNWTLESTVNSGDRLLRPKDADMRFYKAVLEPGDL